MRQTITIKAAPHTAQAEINASSARFRVVDAGRRFGKTRLGIGEALEVAAGGGRAWWISPTYKMSEVGWRPIRQITSRIRGTEVRKADRMVILPSGGEVCVRSADNPDSLRGEGLDYVVFDECAYMKRETWSEAIRPALSDTGGRALFISTPRGRNWFWDLWNKGQAGDPNWRSWQFPTAANPYIKPAEIAAAKLDLPEVTFRQEYLAEFVDSEGAVFRRVHDAAVLEPLDDPVPGRTYVAGVDVASIVDYTVITVLDAESMDMVYMDRYNRLDYPVLVDRLIAANARWKLAALVVEANSIGRPVIDLMVKRGLTVTPFTTTSATKQAIIQALQNALENATIRIINNPVLVGELLSYESKRSASGSFTYGAPAGVHDDCVMSLALALRGITRGPTGADLVGW